MAIPLSEHGDDVEAIVPTVGGSARPASGGFRSLGNVDFRLLWFGLLFSQGAQQMNLVSRSWLAYHISGSGAALGIVAIASGLPMALCSLFAGALADRM